MPHTPAVPGRLRPPARVRRHSVRGQVLDALRAAVTGGELRPGEVYSAPALGERFGVSATPVREAMQQLAAEGAVEILPNRGFRVLAPSERDLAELAEVRALLLVPLLHRLAAGLPPERRVTLSRLAADDAEFHEALVALSGNRQLVRVAGELRARARPPAAPQARRQALVDALAAGDTAAAEAVLRELLGAPERP
ncbi:GntR family transcriptional regulator [Streptomyces sp. B8F3]|uniref:GntR family transcriptional regulator n=1 Tax=unclassified Streptomyces TaxID=2593676 RepID=UPI00325D096A